MTTKDIFMICIIASLIFSCKPPTVDQTIEEFGQDLIEALKEKDEPGFSQMLLNKSDLKEVFNYSNGQVKIEQVKQRMENQMSSIYRQIVDVEKLSNVTIDSVKKIPPKKQGMNPRFLFNEEKCEITTIAIYFTDEEETRKKLVLRDCIKLPGTKWKVAKIPEVKTIRN